MRKARRLSLGLSILGVLILLGLAGLLGITGCSKEQNDVKRLPTYGGEELALSEGVSTTVLGAPSETSAAYDGVSSERNKVVSSAEPLTGLEAGVGQKVITDAVLEIQVGRGEFQSAFEQARLLADRYGGYVVSSQAFSGSEEDSMRSGTVVVRVPATAFNRALSDATKLGDLKGEQIQTQDVTEEYVDLQARISNAEAHVKALLTLLSKAQTVEEILQVQQTVTYAQEELERLKGRMRYLEEHTSYATLTMNIHESGVEAASSSDWGFVAALKDALHNLVRAVNAILRGLGILIPVLVVLGIIGYVLYLVVRAIARRSRQRRQVPPEYPPQGWSAGTGPEQRLQPNAYQPTGQQWVGPGQNPDQPGPGAGTGA